MHNEKNKVLALYRLDRAKELIADAWNLYNTGSYKSANNRAYYSIFHAMRAVLALDEVDFKKHSGVIQYFQREYIKTGIFEKSCSTIIMSASEIRNASDYDDFYLASAEEAQEQIDNAVAFAGVIEEYLNNALDK